MPLAGFDLRVNALVPRLDWVKPVSVLGADRWGTLFVVPMLDLDLALSPVPGVTVKGRKRGLGDLTIGNGLHWTFPTFDMVNAVDVVVPTGNYDAADFVNPGQNKWVFRLNHMGTWHPAPAWDVSYRLHWDYNFSNSATDYHSGQTVYLNWAIGWKPRPQMTVGLAGYYLRQVTDDRQAGHVVGPDGNRTRVDGIGPCVKYFLPNHVMLTAKYFREFNARNHPEGDQFWLQVTVPLGARLAGSRMIASKRGSPRSGIQSSPARDSTWRPKGVRTKRVISLSASFFSPAQASTIARIRADSGPLV